MKLISTSALAQPAEKKAITPMLLCFLWVIVCYQVGYQLLVSFVLRQDRQAVDPWCASGTQPSSQECIEAGLFQGWQADASGTRSELVEPGAPLLLQRVDSLKPPPTTAPSKPLGNQSAEASQVLPPIVARAVVATGNPPTILAGPPVALTPWAQGLKALQTKYEDIERNHKKRHALSLHKRVQRRHQQHVRLAQETLAEWGNMSSWARGLRALQQRIGGHLAGPTADNHSANDLGELTAWAKDLEALQQRLETRFSDRAAHIKTAAQDDQTSNMTAWSTELEALQHRMEVRMQVHEKSHEVLGVQDARIEAHKKAHKNPEDIVSAQPQGTILEEIAKLGRELCGHPERSGRSECDQFRAVGHGSSATGAAVSMAPLAQQTHSLADAHAKLHMELLQLAERHKSWEMAFAAKVANVGRTLCIGRSGDSNSSCAQFQSDGAEDRSNATLDSQDTAEQRRSWHEAFTTKLTNIGEELCRDPSRQDYLVCKKLFAKATAVVSTTQKPDAAAKAEPHPALNWTTVTQWKKASAKGLRGSVQGGSVNQTLADMSNLRSSRWISRVPSVACIALVPQGKSAQTWMRYFVDNFKLQKYEGAVQLVLVYHYSDLETAELVHDLREKENITIRGAAARGTEYPSAAAYRFGAWVARDADVVARWDFAAWHHPHRLSMQVRALASSARPACLLDRWTTLNDKGNQSTAVGGLHWDSSFVGEAAWMREHWYPDMKEEHAVIAGAHAREVVKLTNPKLLVFNDAE